MTKAAKLLFALILIIFSVLALASFRPTEDPAATARAILRDTGVQGGLVVHLGCGDGRLSVALRANERFLVHGLDADPGDIAAARKYAAAKGLEESVTFSVLHDRRLPFIDNVASLVVAEELGRISSAEIMRVLRPGGVAYIKRGGAWKKAVKPWPAQIDEWTHFLHGPDGNIVANDSRVGPPFHMQWVATPRHSKTHSHLSSINVMVSSAGRLFYIADEGLAALPDLLPSRWYLVARDAFSGIVLWRRPITSWQPADMSSRHIFPVDLYRRLVAAGDRVYATLSLFGPVVALDAATGGTIRVFQGTEKTEEILHADGTLFLVVGTEDPAKVDRRQLALRRFRPVQKRLLAVRADSGKLLWEKCDEDTASLIPMTLAVSDGRVFYQDTKNVVCLDAQTGEVLWRAARPSPYERPGWSAPTLVAAEGVVLSADRQASAGKIPEQRRRVGVWREGTVVAFSAKTGERLWECPCAEGCGAPVDVFVIDGKVIVGENVGRKEPDYRTVRDLRTGKIVAKHEQTEGWVSYHHHRCYRDKATRRYILAGRTGVEFINVATGEITPHLWIRGICKFGVLPCNGLLYLPPDQCGCYIESKLTGFHCLAPRRERESLLAPSTVVERGPAFSWAQEAARGEPVQPGDWPTFRANPARSGAAGTAVPLDLRPAWRAKLGGKLTQPVVANGRLFVAATDKHTLFALDCASGKTLWTFRAGARIDSPPTVAGGLVVFGCRDGWVYALRASDGALAWRFRAAPEERFLVARGQVESVWPVHGSVLVQQGAVYCAAGRSSYLDGGVFMYKLDLGSGAPLLARRYYSRDPKTGRRINLYEPYPAELLPDRELPGVLPDILSTDGENIWMRSVTFDRELNIREEHPPHLFCSMGFLDDTWWERTYWIYGPHFFSGAAGVHYAKYVSAAGRILVCDERDVYGYQDDTFPETGLFCAGKEPKLVKSDSSRFRKSKYRNARKTKVVPNWRIDVPLYPHGLALAGDVLFAAGPPRFNEQRTRDYLDTCASDDFRLIPVLQEALDSFLGKKGGVLWAVRKTDGAKLAELALPDSPSFDGLIAANGALYLSTKSGSVLCLRGAS